MGILVASVMAEWARKGTLYPLDTMATRACGTTTASVQWGTWADAGMAVEKGTFDRTRRIGIGAVSNADGMRALAALLHMSASMMGVPLSHTLEMPVFVW